MDEPVSNGTRSGRKTLNTAIPHLDGAPILAGLRRAFWLGGGAIVALGLTFLLLYWLNARSLEILVHSQQTGRMAREARNLALDRHSAIRGYLLSHQRISLAPEFAARAPLYARLDSLLLLTQDHASQHDRAKAIRESIRRWERGWAQPALEADDLSSVSEAAAQSLAGKEFHDSIRAAFSSFLESETRIYTQRLRILRGIGRITVAAIILELLVLLAVLAILGKRSMKYAREVLHQREVLESQAEDLQQQATELEEQAVELEEQADEANRNAHALESMNKDLEATVARLQAAEHEVSTVVSQKEETQGLLDFVLNNSPVGVAVFDRERRFLRVNAAMASMTGAAAAEHTGRKLSDIATDELVDALEPVIERVSSTGEAVTNVPIIAAGSDDPTRDRHFLFSFFPVRLPGRLIGVGTVALETTQFRQLEEQLLVAQKMEAVGRLAGGVAHDFNNMLTAIRSYGELILAEMTEGTQEHLDMTEIIKAAERATALTKKLLAFSRQQVLLPSRVDLNATVESLQKMLHRIVGKNVDLTCKLGDDLWPVNADPTEIERVITNLVLNSHDAMPDGGRLIIETANVEIDDEYANTHADTKPGPYVMIAVTDTGTGMTKEVREKLFEPFFTTKEKGKGTGLGLPSVYGIVKQSGGFVWVYSELGHGTTVKVYLPRAEEPVQHEDGRPRTPRNNRQVGQETILLVEDDDEVREVTMRILRNNGYNVLEATNGADALKVCEAQPYPVDLVVTDIVMPEMGGTELAEKIRETQPDARILFTSGYTEDAAVRQSFMHPGEAFIEKPFTPASLTRKARELLESNGSEEHD